MPPASTHSGAEPPMRLKRRVQRSQPWSAAKRRRFFFASGATESINLALKGVMASEAHDQRHLITAATEHKATLDTAHALETAGTRVTILPVDRYGVISTADLDAALSGDTRLVSLMAANNETGTLGPIREAAARAHDAGALFHSDDTPSRRSSTSRTRCDMTRSSETRRPAAH